MRYLLIALLSLSAASSAQTLPEQARDHDVKTFLIVEYNPLPIEGIARNSDAIVQGTITAIQPRLSDNQGTLNTEYDVRVDAIVKKRPALPLEPGRTIVVEREGGTMILSGHQIEVENNDFPPFELDQQVILFLYLQPNESRFHISSGSLGAFLNVNGAVRQASRGIGDWNRTRGTKVPVADFLREISRLRLRN